MTRSDMQQKDTGRLKLSGSGVREDRGQARAATRPE
jgi:hypothetical protein